MVLIGYWPLNESSGSTAYDHSGNENHGTINDGGDSTVPGATGILGQNAYSFDGSNDYISVPHSNSLHPRNHGFSVSLWFKSNSKNGRFLGTDENGDYWWQIQIRDSKNEKVWAGFDDNDSISDLQSNKGSYDDQKWHHVAVTRKKEASYRMFVDGRQVDETPDNGDIAITSRELYIGAYHYRSNGDDFHHKGSLAGVRIYNHALTKAEIQYLYSVSQRGRQTSSSKQS